MIHTRAFERFAPIAFGLSSGPIEFEHHIAKERPQDSIQNRRKTVGNLGGRPKTNNEKEVLFLRL